MKKFFVAVFCLVFTVAFATVTEKLSDEVRPLYRTLLTDKNYEKKKAAVEQLKALYVKTKMPEIIDVAIDLLKYSYEHKNFREDNQVMYYNDRIAMRLVDILKLSRDPKCFGVLLTIVVARQHTDTTIMHAWDAIKNIDWKMVQK